MQNEFDLLNRRQTLALLGGAGAAALTAHAASTCVPLAGAQTEGSYWVEEMLNRSDVRVDPANGSTRPGVLMNLAIVLQEASGSSCGPLAGAKVDIWHCDASGFTPTRRPITPSGRSFCGAIRCLTTAAPSGSPPSTRAGIADALYTSMCASKTYSGTTILDNFTLQIFFDDTVTDQVFVSAAPYNQRRARDTRNANNMVLTGTRNGSVVYAELTGNADNSYSALATIGLNVKAAVAAKPVISAAGVVNAGGFQPGLTPGAWTTIFGQNRAAASQSLASSDIAGGALPSALGGVTVRMGSEAAFVDFVSPTRINVQAPASVGNGAVAVTVSTAGGTSDAVTVPGQPILPALFAFQGYAAGTSNAKLGAVVELYGTGFGTTDPAVLPGTVSQGSAPVTNPVAVTIGGATAAVSYAGLVSTGLYQLNVTIPSLTDGDYPVVARIGGISTQPGVLLKIRS